jgi:hypothetical protein
MLFLPTSLGWDRYIYADVKGNGSRLPRIGRSAGTPGVGASLTAFRSPADLGLRRSSLRERCVMPMDLPFAGQFWSPREMAKEPP